MLIGLAERGVLMAKDTIKKALANALDLDKPTSVNLTAPAIVPIEVNESPSYLPILSGKGTDSIRDVLGSPAVTNEITKETSFKSGTTEIIIKGRDKATGMLGVSTDKLLRRSIAQFTAINNTGEKKKSVNTKTVLIPLKEYASDCGYDVYEHTTSTEAEAKKEAKRAENQLNNFRRKVKKDLDIIYDANISWKEAKAYKGKQADYEDVRVLQGRGIRNGYIKLTFSDDYASYLITLPINQFPRSLLKLDERNRNAYEMGLQISFHYNMDNNQIVNTADRLKVSTILESGRLELPSIDDVRKKRKDWRERIKEPFERCLDALHRCGFLEDWYYCHPKGERLSDEEASALDKDYEAWAETLLHFSLVDAVDHTPRLEAKKQRAEENKKSRKSKTKKTDSE